MGTFSYADGTEWQVDDRALYHLQLVIGAKLRRRESFYFSWTDRRQAVTTVWLSSAIAIAFSYDHRPALQVNRRWVDTLLEAANAPTGLLLLPEPQA